MFSERIYELYARWEQANEDGTPFDPEPHATPEERAALQRLIADLNPPRDNSANDPELPPSTSRYRFVEFIARGGMGEVYRGEDTVLRRTVALKVLRQRLGVSAEKFRSEAQLVARLTHPGIVPIHDFGELSDGRPFFAMKLVEGKTLEEVLGDANAQSPQLPRWLQYFEQICQAVAYAHSQNPPLLHRDLKPQNVMIGAYGEVLVMDWGIARVVAEALSTNGPVASPNVVTSDSTDESVSGATPNETATGVAKGTVAYMAPEQARGERDQIGPHSDVFGLGGILCRMLTGKPTFVKDEDWTRVLAGDVSGAQARLDACGADTDVVEMAHRCLASDFNDRYRDAGEVASAVQAYLASVQEKLNQAEVERARVEAKADGERRRRRVVAALAVSVLVLIVGAASAAFWWQSRRAAELQMRLVAQGQIREMTTAADRVSTEAYSGADLRKFDEAEALMQNALAVARGSGEDERPVLDQIDRLNGSRARVRLVRDVLIQCADILGREASGKLSRSAEKSAGVSTHQRFERAFRRLGIAVGADSDETTAERLRTFPKALLPELLAGLDGWWQAERKTGRTAVAEKIASTANDLDGDPTRAELRRTLLADAFAPSQAITLLTRVLLPCSELLDDPPTPNQRRVRALADRIDPATDPAMQTILVSRGLKALGDVRAAERLLRRATTVQPQQHLYWAELGALYLNDSTKKAELIECWRSVRSLLPGSGVGLVFALMGHGRDDEAIEIMDRLRSQRPDDNDLLLDAIFVLGGVDLPSVGITPNVSLDRLERAAKLCEEGIRRVPDERVFVTLYAVTLHQLGRHDAATVALAKGPPIPPGNTQALLDESIRKAEGAVRNKPDDLEYRYGLAMMLVWAKRYDEAERTCREGLRIDPANPRIHHKLGDVAEGRGDRAGADAAYRQAVTLGRKDTVTLSRAGEYYIRSSQWSEAADAYGAALELQPRHPVLMDNYALALLRLGNLQQAEEVARAELKLVPGIPQPYDILGEILVADGRFRAGEAQYRKWLDAHPNTPSTAFRLSRLLHALSRDDEAVSERGD